MVLYELEGTVTESELFLLDITTFTLLSTSSLITTISLISLISLIKLPAIHSEQTEKNKMASRFASIAEEKILSINEAAVPKNTKKWQLSLVWLYLMVSC